MRTFLAILSLVFLTTSMAFAAKPPKISRTKKDAKVNCDQQLAPTQLNDDDDVYLEEVHGEKALEWVRTENDRSLDRLESDPRFTQIRDSVLEAMDSPDRLPEFSIRKGFVYNFWKDAKNKKGLVRRVPYQDFMNGSRDWDVYLDVDALAAAENENWVYKGSQAFGDRRLMTLSRGGKDASVIREFDISTKSFVKGGFVLPEGKHRVTWLDQDTLLVGLARANHPEDVSKSGYPVHMRVWKRGTPVENAPIILTIGADDMSVGASVDREVTDGPATAVILENNRDFYHSDTYFMQPDYTLKKLDIPDDAQMTVDRGSLYVKTMSPWTLGGETFSVGTLLRFNLENFLAGKKTPEVLFVSKHESILEDFNLHKGRVLLTVKQHVVARVYELEAAKGKFTLRQLVKNSDPFVMQSLYASDDDEDVLVLTETGYLTPTTRTLINMKDNSTKLIDRSKEWFDASPYVVEQNFATSKDGTKVPYFVVRRKDMKFDGQQPVLQYGYGGFLVSEEPFYSVSFSRGWLEQGGVLVVANIRGGGEYGAEWHDAAIKENRQRAYDDFHSVAEDLISRKVTSPKHLGVMGGSNGGLLTGVAFTQRPDLYNAAVISVPLLDMLRYHKLLAGASWMAEYGDPDVPAEAEYIRKYSPYHNIKPGVQYPEPFFNTSTADDRVHPAHARRTAARMQKLNHPFLYYENLEGGHGGAANNDQSARLLGLEYVYLLQKLKD